MLMCDDDMHAADCGMSFSVLFSVKSRTCCLQAMGEEMVSAVKTAAGSA